MKLFKIITLAVFTVISLITPIAHADTAQVNVKQRLEEPIAKIYFSNASGLPISNPTLDFPLRTANFKCQTNVSNGNATHLSTSDQKLALSIPDRSSVGWDVSLEPTNGAAAGWMSAEHPGALAINDDTNNGCNPALSGTSSFGGLLKVDPSGLHADGVCSTDCGDAFTSPIKGSAMNFAQSNSASIYRSDTPHVGWEGTLTGINLEQTIPAGTPSGDYSLPLTLTLTEL